MGPICRHLMKTPATRIRYMMTRKSRLSAILVKIRGILEISSRRMEGPPLIYMKDKMGFSTSSDVIGQGYFTIIIRNSSVCPIYLVFRKYK